MPRSSAALAALLIPLLLTTPARAQGNKAARGVEINVDAEDQDLADLAKIIAKKTNSTIFVGPRAQREKVTLSLRQIPWRDALDVIARMTRCEVTVLAGGSVLLEKPPCVTYHGVVAVQDVLTEIARVSSATLLVAPDVGGKVTLDLEEVRTTEALKILATAQGLVVGRRGSIVTVSTVKLASAPPAAPVLDVRPTLPPQTRQARVSVAVKNGLVFDLLQDVARKARVNLIPDPTIDAEITLAVDDAPWVDVVLYVAWVTGLSLEARGSVVIATPPASADLRVGRAPAAQLFRGLGAYAGTNVVVAPGVTETLVPFEARKARWSDLVAVVPELNGYKVTAEKATVTIGADAATLDRIARVRQDVPPPPVKQDPGALAIEVDAALAEYEKGNLKPFTTALLTLCEDSWPRVIEVARDQIKKIWHAKLDRKRLANLEVELDNFDARSALQAIERGVADLDVTAVTNAARRLDAVIARFRKLRQRGLDVLVGERARVEPSIQQAVRAAVAPFELQATFVDPRPESKNRAVIDGVLVEEGDLLGDTVRVDRIEDGLVRLRCDELRFVRKLAR